MIKFRHFLYVFLFLAILYVPFSLIINFSSTESVNQKHLWDLIQDWRISQNLKPYIESQKLCIIAEDRAKDGSDKHFGLLRKYNNLPFILSENSTGAYSASEALSNWLNSPPHRAALEKPYKYTCVRCMEDFCVQIFSNLENDTW